MRAATIRRSLVFGVCALGVGALYLAPSVGRSSYQVGQPTLNDEPTAQPTPSVHTASASLSSRPATTAATAKPQSSTESSQSSEPTASGSAAARATPRGSVTTTADPRSVRSSRGTTAPQRDDRRDNEPPQPVEKITPSKVTPEQLSLDWSEAADNVRVIGYHVWLSGFQVASTAETHATVRWFNDDTAQQVVQVKAVDAAGNEAPTSPTLLVSRPDPDPTGTPQPSDPPTTQPEPSSAASATDDPSVSTRVAPASPTPTSSGGAG